VKLKHTLLVTVVAEAGLNDAAFYVRDAVRSLGGCHPPGTAFFALPAKAVRVKPVSSKPLPTRPRKLLTSSGRITALEVDLMVNLYAKKLSPYTISSVTGRSVYAVRQHLQKRGVLKRTMREAALLKYDS
jgi:hypothetical protein